MTDCQQENNSQKAAKESADHIVRGTAAEGMIRAFAISATDTVQTAQNKHSLSAVGAAALGRLMMAAQIMGSFFKVPGEQLTLVVDCEGPFEGLIVGADSEGHVKGYIKNPLVDGPAQAVPEAIGQGSLTVIRETPHVEPYMSQIQLVASTISDDLIAYYIVSEQIPTIVVLDALVNPEGLVENAGGYFIQLMPGYDEALLVQFETALSSSQSVTNMLEKKLSPEEMLNEVLAGLDFKAYEETPVSFQCNCSRERSERTLISLGKTELEEMISDDEAVDIKCDFCNSHYEFTPTQLQELVDSL